MYPLTSLKERSRSDFFFMYRYRRYGFVIAM